MNLIKGQISKLLAFDIIIGGHSKKSTFNVEGEGGGGGERGPEKANKNEQSEGGQVYLYICSVKKIAWQLLKAFLF